MVVAEARDVAPDTRGHGGPPGGGPRFALRFEDGRGRLTLAKPLRFGLGVVERLELDLGPLRFPLDLSAGPGRFSHRRTRVRHAHLVVDLTAVVANVVEAPYQVRPLAPVAHGLAWALRDSFGTLAFETRIAAEGPDLRLAITEARTATEGPAPPLVRAHVAARALGLRIDEEGGVFTVPRVLSALLTEALVPHGWRVPDDRGARLAVTVRGPHRLELRSLEAGEAERPNEDPVWETSRRLWPIVCALALGDVEEARRAWRMVRERTGEAGTGLRREMEALGLEPLSVRSEGPVARTLQLRVALREGRVEDAAEHARALADEEPCDAVAVEALCASVDLASSTHPALAASLLDRAVSRRPSDGRLALRLSEILARLGRVRELGEAIDTALVASEPGPERGALAREAATVCELAGQVDLAARMWTIAYEHLPTDPRVLEGMANAEERRGEQSRAQALYDRAASAYRMDGDPEAEARVSIAAARVAEAGGHADVAEDRLTRVAERTGSDPTVWASLARVRRRLGSGDAVHRADDRLLASLEHVSPGGASPIVVEGLVQAARAALAGGRTERARAFAVALERVQADAPELAGLAARLAELELRESASDPERMWGLPADLMVRVLASASDPRAVLNDAVRQVDPDRVPARLVEAARCAAEEPRVAAALADVAVDWVDGIQDAAVLLDLAPRASSSEGRAALARAASALFREVGDEGRAALALARAGVARRDTAMLRAALTAAERAGAVAVAREIVDLALGVVGGGPARAALLTVRRRLEERG